MMKSQTHCNNYRKVNSRRIRNSKLPLDSYPNKDDITDSINENSCWKPNLLNIRLSYAVPDTVKRSSICQCVIKASPPCTWLPLLLFGLGIDCDHVFGSKWLVNELFKLGFSISYFEVNRFKKSVVVNQSVGNSVRMQKYLHANCGGTILITLLELQTGQGPFNGMGIIAISTPFPGNFVLKESDKISRGKDITSAVYQ